MKINLREYFRTSNKNSQNFTTARFVLNILYHNVKFMFLIIFVKCDDFNVFITSNYAYSNLYEYNLSF